MTYSFSSAALFIYSPLPRSRSRHLTASQSRCKPPCTSPCMLSPASFRDRYGPWALITGASSGIGEEFARQLAHRQLSLILVARRENRLRRLADTLAASCNIQTRVIVADLTQPQAYFHIEQECEDLEVGLLVNNAGIEFHGSFFNVPAEQHQNMIDLNITAVTALTHVFARKMCLRRKGGVLFVSSISASGFPWLATYAATKSFVTCLALTLRDELLRNGVDCMALEPGLVESEMTINDPENPPDTSLQSAPFCVSEALRVFGEKPVFTPGLMNRLLKNVLLLLPRPLALWLLSEFILSKSEDKSDFSIKQ